LRYVACGLNNRLEANKMMPLELLAMIGAGAVLPYVAEGAIDWIKHHGRHLKCAHAPD
jgi:hypothetical protein